MMQTRYLLIASTHLICFCNQIIYRNFRNFHCCKARCLCYFPNNASVVSLYLCNLILHLIFQNCIIHYFFKLIKFIWIYSIPHYFMFLSFLHLRSMLSNVNVFSNYACVIIFEKLNN